MLTQGIKVAAYLNTGATGSPRALTPSASPTSKESGLLRIAGHPKQTGWKCRYTYYSLGKKKKEAASPPAFPARSFHRSLEQLQELPLQVYPRVYLLFIPRQISNQQPLPELSETTLWLPHLRLRSQAFPSVPRLQVLWKVPATGPPPPQMLLISPTAKISFFSGLRLLSIRVGKMKGKQIQRHGWKYK